MTDLKDTAHRLCQMSRDACSDRHQGLEWSEDLDRDQWFMSPELISLYGTETYASMSEEQRKRLSLLEAVNFFSLNIHGEKSLVEGLAARLYRKGNEAISPYLHHFLDEENKHMACFASFCGRYGGRIYPDKKMVFPRDYADGEEDFLFFAKVMIFEEIVDAYNVRMAKDERLAPIVRQINRMHHLDEARHLAFGRVLVPRLFERYRKRSSAEPVRGIREYLASYLLATWKEYYNPDVYRDAGLHDPVRLQREAFDSERAREHRRATFGRCFRALLKAGILDEEVVA